MNIQSFLPERKRTWVILSLVALGLFWLYAACFDTQIVSFLHDDGVYSITAKALAEGKGYTLLNLPDTPTQAKYPILYPLLLSVTWLANSTFPDNLGLMHTITALFAVAAIPLLYLYLRQVKQISVGLAALILLLVASSFHFIFFSTSIMSEAPYFFLSLLGLWIAEKTLPTNSKKWLTVVILISALAFHTRTIGISLIGAIFVWLLIQKQFKTAFIYLAATLAISVIPWLIWVKLHAPHSVTALNYPFAYVYGGYGIEYDINAPDDIMGMIQAIIIKGIQPLLEALPHLLFPLAPHLLSNSPIGTLLVSLFLTGIFLLLTIQSAKKHMYSISGLYVVFYIGLVTLWLYPNQSVRFLVVILPWLWLYFFQFWMNLSRQWLRPKMENIQSPKRLIVLKGATLLLLSVLTLWPAIQGYQLLKHMRANHYIEPSGQYAALWSDYQAVFDYLRTKTPPNARIAGIFDPVFYLYTDRPTFGLFTSALQPIDGMFSEVSFEKLLNSMRHYNVQYAVMEPYMLNQIVQSPTNPVLEGLIRVRPEAFKAVYTAPNGRLTIYQVQPVSPDR